MDSKFVAALRRATRSASAGKTAEAMRVMQEALGRTTAAPDMPASPFGGQRPFRLRKPMSEVIASLQAGRRAMTDLGAFSGLATPRPAPAPADLPPGAQFVTRSFAGPAGSRAFRLYIPASAAGGARGLLVMLHGCKQDADDFAAGTGMNAQAEAHGLLVAYPNQTQAANPSACWNWFNPADQMRDAGEPAIIAGLTRALAAEFGIGRDDTFVAGLSAGAAMAVVMGETYPDLYAAVGAHSGLAYRSANDAMSAFTAMRGDVSVEAGPAAQAPAVRPPVRTIVFQGTADATVNAANGGRIVAQAEARLADGETHGVTERGKAGRAYSRTMVFDRSEVPLVEYWLVEGAGHAWSGGKPAGSYTDPAGPDASAAMMRFFLA